MIEIIDILRLSPSNSIQKYVGDITGFIPDVTTPTSCVAV